MPRLAAQPRRPAPVVVALVVALAAALGARGAWADALLVLVRTDADRALMQRVQGQLADLAVTVDAVADPAPPGASTEQQWVAAARLAAARHADAVAWLAAEPATTPDAAPRGAPRAVLRVYLRRTRRLLERVVEEGRGGSAPTPDAGASNTAPSSVTLEAAALVVRNALQADASGTPVGEPAPAAVVAASETAAPDRGPPPAAPPPRTPPPRPPPAPSRARAAPGDRRAAPAVHASLGAGWRALIDGYPGAGRHAVAARLGVTVGAAEVSLEVVPGIGTDVAQPTAALVLVRHALEAVACFRAGPWSGFELLLGAHAGGALYGRTTVSTAPGFDRTNPSWTFTPVFGLRAGLRWSPPVNGPRPLIDLVLGGDVAPGTPALGWGEGTAFRTTANPWLVQPWGQLGAGLYF